MKLWELLKQPIYWLSILISAPAFAIGFWYFHHTASSSMVLVDGTPQIVIDHPPHAYVVEYGFVLLGIVLMTIGITIAGKRATKLAEGKRDVEPPDGSDAAGDSEGRGE